MATKSIRSIEGDVQDQCKSWLGKEKFYIGNAYINSEIENALQKSPSKNGGKGRNYPDIQLLLDSSYLSNVPVMIEVKGKRGLMIKDDGAGRILNTKVNGEANYANITKYAVNGAIHYSEAILKYSDMYNAVIAVGVNGFPRPDGQIKYEIHAYYISKRNLFIPKKIAEYQDLSFLLTRNHRSLAEKIELLYLTVDEAENRKLELEDEMERNLKAMNQNMEDNQIADIDSRIRLIAGMVMAGLGVRDESGAKWKVRPLEISDLKGEEGELSNDGQVIMRRIYEFLQARDLPHEKIELIKTELTKAFIFSKLQNPVGGASILRKLYSDVKDKLLIFLRGDLHNIDFTGRLFNAITEWTKTPQDPDHDIVLTPRYVTELMAKLCNVNMNSYVWDFASGSGGFLISAMHLMLQDARNRIQSPDDLRKKEKDIKFQQLLGVEKSPGMYMLAVLNMILMQDGSSNLINEDSIVDYHGQYEQGKNKGKDFPADVFLLNPPYSQPGKGFIFVTKALKYMNRKGRAAILIKDSAGSGQGLPYTKEILENNTLVASIKMDDIFFGVVGVRTYIFVFDINKPHNPDSVVKFIDFSYDGYKRSKRKKSSQSVNLQDIDNAKERYAEIERLVNIGRGKNDVNLKYYKEHYFEDYITLNGDDWTYEQHVKLDTRPKMEDFQSVVKDYLAWRVSQVLKERDEEDSLGKK